MKKYFVLSMSLFVLACNSNTDKVSDDSPGKSAYVDSTSGEGLISGKFVITEYKKDNVKVDLIKKEIQFTKDGGVLKWDGTSFSYRLIGDSLEFYIAPSTIISRSKIEFLTPDSSSFILINPTEKTEFTYKKIN
jgi:hypothetical protein